MYSSARRVRWSFRQNPRRPVHCERIRRSKTILCVRTSGQPWQRTESPDSGHPSATINIIDTGIGISSEDRQIIFERFSRAARPLHGDFPGSGLGLVLAQWIAQKHGSTIQVQSSIGQGSCFGFSLPMSPAGQKPQTPEDLMLEHLY